MSLIRKFSLIDEINTRELELTSNSNVPVELKDSSGNAIDLQVKTNANTSSIELLVNLEGHQCTDNSTSTPLGIGGVFIGSGWQDTLDYGVLSIDVVSDKASAVNGLDVQWSVDGINVIDHDYFSIMANNPKTFTFGPARRYYRIVYTNGATAQTTFSMTSLLRRVYVKPSSHRINDAIIGQDDAELVKAVLTGENPGGTFVNFQATTSGNFKVSLEELESGISVNSNSQLKTTPYGSTGIEAKQDRSTGAMACIDYEHSEIHAGDHYFIKDWSDIAGSTTVDFLVVTPNTTKWAHMVLEFSFEAEANITVYEGATTSANGTAITINNRQRNSVNTAGITAFTGPTVTTTGTSIARYKAGTGKSAGGEVRAAAELVLKQNTKYLIRVINDTVTTNWCDYLADWYEHTNN